MSETPHKPAFDEKYREMFRKTVEMYLDFERKFNENAPPFPKEEGKTIIWERHKK